MHTNIIHGISKHHGHSILCHQCTRVPPHNTVRIMLFMKLSGLHEHLSAPCSTSAMRWLNLANVFCAGTELDNRERERRDEGPVGAEFTHNLVICSGLGVSYLSSGSIIHALCCMHNKSQCVQAATSSLSRAGLCPGVSTPASYL